MVSGDNKMESNKVTTPTVRALLRALREALDAPRAEPPVGSNRSLGMGLCHLLVWSVVPLMVLMVVGALLSDSVSQRSTLISAGWLCFVAPIALLMHRIPERFVRGLLFLSLMAIQVRWSLAWIRFPPEDVFASVMITLIFTPLLLFLVALMEGRRTGVLVGLLVAANMGAAVSIGAFRESLAALSLTDPRFGIPTFVVMLLYAVAVNTWTSQQELLQDAQLQLVLLQERANCDPPTGLLNRRGLDMVVAGWRDRGAGFAVLMVQLDNMQQRLQALGAERAESDLQTLAGQIDALPDETVTVARWSENTLVLLSRHAERVSAERLAQQLRRHIAGPSDRNVEDELSVSIGYTLFSGEDDFEAAANRAESALATALQTGNCVRALLVV